MPASSNCKCCAIPFYELVLSYIYPCETGDVLTAFEHASASACFYLDGSGDEFDTLEETYDCDGTPTVVTTERGGIVGPNTSLTPPSCPAEVVTGDEVGWCTLTSTAYSGSIDASTIFATASPGTPTSGGFGTASSPVAISYTITRDGSDNMLTATRSSAMIAIDISSFSYPQTVSYQVQYDYTFLDLSTSTVNFSAVEVEITPGGTEEILGIFDHPPILDDTSGATTTVTITQCS